jgi:1,4-alpha-glucan branching enzyme
VTIPGRDEGILRIPAPEAHRVVVRLAALAHRDRFDPTAWRHEPLRASATAGYHEIDLHALDLPDGHYEYEFVVEGRAEDPVADPYAEEITRFGGYRGIFAIRGGRRYSQPFSWEDELPPGIRLPDNNELVIEEVPMRWMASPTEDIRQMGLGTFDRFVFERLEELAALGVNAIELLPAQDSPDTLNWGYGTRFFFAPDIDMGTPVDLKVLVKRCHQRGIRVILDVVMNHSRECPLERLAGDWFFLQDGSEEGGRPGWGGRIFRYRRPAPDGHHPAREFHHQMAEYWVKEYRVDGFRIDEFKGIDHWEFVQAFRDRATTAHRELFPGRPFLVIAEDTWRRTEITQARSGNPGGRQVVDAMWNFAFRDEARRLLTDRIHSDWGAPSRGDRIQALVSGCRTWDEYSKGFREGFTDLAQAVNYLTSHDVEAEGEQRLMNQLFGQILRQRELGSGTVEDVRGRIADMAGQPHDVRLAHQDALDRVGSAFALVLTSVGIPMFLAGEEFADVHDLDHGDWRLKMSDPVDWRRRDQPGHRELWGRVGDLVRLRASHEALQRNEVAFFYLHPSIDQGDGVRAFAYCRTAGRPLGSDGQVVVAANCGPHDFPKFDLPWPWLQLGQPLERGAPPRGTTLALRMTEPRATLSLAPFQVRVFCP